MKHLSRSDFNARLFIESAKRPVFQTSTSDDNYHTLESGIDSEYRHSIVSELNEWAPSYVRIYEVSEGTKTLKYQPLTQQEKEIVCGIINSPLSTNAEKHGLIINVSINAHFIAFRYSKGEPPREGSQRLWYYQRDFATDPNLFDKSGLLEYIGIEQLPAQLVIDGILSAQYRKQADDFFAECARLVVEGKTPNVKKVVQTLNGERV